jgi:hypothetical protein
MRSEIPQIEVVTAIADADFEDFIAQLLFSQGWSIIYRAFDSQALRDFLATRGALRTVIVYKIDLPGFTSDLMMEYEDLPFTFISLDGSEAAAHAVMQKIRSQLRLPLVHAPKSEPTLADEPSKPTPKIYTITGSSGSPGRSSLALALGEEIASKGSSGSRVNLIDADFRSHSLTRRFSVSKSALTLIPFEESSKPRTLPELRSAESAIVDIGALPSLGEAVHDRRWYGNLISSILESTSHLLYVVRSTEESMDELGQFLKEFPLLLRSIPITYICILVGTSRELRQAEARFLTLTTGENRFLIRESQLLGSASLFGSLMGSSHGGAKTGKSEIGKIAQSLR